MDPRTHADHELEGVADLVEEAAGDAWANTRWLRDNLREALDAFGVRRGAPGAARDVTGSDPDDT